MIVIGWVIVALLVILNFNITRLNDNVINIAKVYARYIDRKESA